MENQDEPHYAAHHYYKTTPGCLRTLAALMISGAAGLGLAMLVDQILNTPVGADRVDNAPLIGLTFFVTPVIVFVVLMILFRRTAVRLICPNCGVRTDPSFRVCRSCGRVKETETA